MCVFNSAADGLKQHPERGLKVTLQATMLSLHRVSLILISKMWINAGLEVTPSCF